jgi:DNA-binding PadR family transcriptional regulator
MDDYKCNYVGSDMQLPSTKEFELLALLIHGERSGRELAKAYKKEAARSISYGTLYVTLNRMVENGWVASREETDEVGKLTIYKITSGGRAAVNCFRSHLRNLSNFGLECEA